MKILLALLLLLSTVANAQLIGDTENGLASYYSRAYDGAETAYGLTYDRNKMVAAHKTFPVNSTVRVKNLDNGKTVQVKIIDKGPFIRGRIIEVSERAADLLGMLNKVSVPVEVTLVSLAPSKATARVAAPVQSPTPASGRSGEVVPAASSTASDASSPATARVTPQPSTTDIPEVSPAMQSNPKPVTAIPSPTRPAPAAAPRKVAAVKASASPAVTREPSMPAENTKEKLAADFAPGIYKINLAQKPEGNFGVQMGTYRDLEAAMEKVAYLQSKWFKDILIERVKITGGSVYKVMLGPFTTEASAARYTKSLKSRYKLDGFVVPLTK
ncbi:septal ring lytic transglycosylase RlpA family protein [Lewinella sp. 4G2]|uniref:septal ring lytic transglycosylase RlpA family protein n=1 Tax=Lewinella sp. 4G2 TaxID=1803372 RepID=UPI0007B4E207|nr:septal ring lytic transglycosylase RlpA family protein [Lewinella sp. 4G2]OAV44740.1 hypothetical protein A3850_009665 [Lewinella sp. 4G2]